ncbi:hypothetical protein QYF36_010648 [Acer negundo]|nr:hypothetical protein QYF36_010648 [Acer negundo]
MNSGVSIEKSGLGQEASFLPWRRGKGRSNHNMSNAPTYGLSEKLGAKRRMSQALSEPPKNELNLEFLLRPGE